MELKISEKGLALIKEFEGCHLTAYQDEVGVWTIGWGITNADKAVTGATIKKGLKITREKAEKWLRDTLNERYAPKVNKYNGKLTTTSRGSASSYYSSKLLGFTTMDRFDAEVPIYTERFVTKDRILSSHQMPD